MSEDDLTPRVFFDAFGDLEQSYALGNKAALYDTLARSNSTGEGLPKWAVGPLQAALFEKWEPRLKEWKGPRKPLNGGYSELLSRYLRAEVYRAAMLWVKNKRYYQRLPTRCIRAWYNGEFDNLPKTNGEAALAVTAVGLKGTFIANISSKTTLEKHRYFGAAPSPVNLSEGDLEMAEAFEMTPEQYADCVSGNLPGNHNLALSFGYQESEVIFGLRDPGQFWGPPEESPEPPEHIKAILNKEPPIMEGK